MKKWIHSVKDIKADASNVSPKSRKLKRTPESGHSYDHAITFDNIEEYLKWWEEDEKYED